MATFDARSSTVQGWRCSEWISFIDWLILGSLKACKIEINDADNKITVFVKNITTGKSKIKSYKVSKVYEDRELTEDTVELKTGFIFKKTRIVKQGCLDI